MQTNSIKDLVGKRVEHANKPGKRIGRVKHLIFHPSQHKVVGFTVGRPDAALMFHRSDIFVALDGYEVVDGVVRIKDESKSTGRAACKRLGVSLDECVIWEGLPVMTAAEERLGYVGDIIFDAKTGELQSLKVDAGVSADLLLGTTELPASLIKGFMIGIGDNLSKASEDDFFRGAIVVSPEALQLKRSGGVAEAAGEKAAVASQKLDAAKEAIQPKIQPKLDAVLRNQDQNAQATEEAITKGAYKIGSQISKTRGMFSSFKEEFKKASQVDDKQD